MNIGKIAIFFGLILLLSNHSFGGDPEDDDNTSENNNSMNEKKSFNLFSKCLYFLSFVCNTPTSDHLAVSLASATLSPSSVSTKCFFLVLFRDDSGYDYRK